VHYSGNRGKGQYRKGLSAHGCPAAALNQLLIYGVLPMHSVFAVLGRKSLPVFMSGGFFHSRALPAHRHLNLKCQMRRRRR